MTASPKQFVSRGGYKLAHALDTFPISVQDTTCADFGSSTGGFTDCLLQYGAKHVYAVETAKNILDWKLRKDERVTVLEGTNALHVELPEPVDFIAIDVSWTKQHLIVPHALTQLKPSGTIVSLVKPHYEAPKGWLTKGRLEEKFLKETLGLVKENLEKDDIIVRDIVESPQLGKKGGNTEYLFWITSQS